MATIKTLDTQMSLLTLDGEAKSLDFRSVVDSSIAVQDMTCYEGMTFYDKDKKELVVVSEVTEDGDFVSSTKLLDSTSEEGLRKLIADTSTGLIQLVEDACSGFQSQIEQTADGLRVEIGQAVENATGLDEEQQQLLSDLKTLNENGGLANLNEISSIKDRLTSVEGDINSAHSTLIADHSQFRSDITKLQKDGGEFSVEIGNLKNSASGLETKYTSIKGDVDKFETRIGGLEVSAGKFLTHFDRLDASGQWFQSQIEQTDNKISMRVEDASKGIWSKITQTENSWTGDFNGLVQRVENLEGASGLTDEQLAQLQALLEAGDLEGIADALLRIDTIEGSIGKITMTNDLFGTQFATKQNYEDLDASSKVAFVNIGQLTANANKLAADFDEYQKTSDENFEDTKTRLGKLEVSAGGFKTKFEEYDSSWSETSSRFAGIEANVSEIALYVNDACTAAAQLNVRANEIEQSIVDTSRGIWTKIVEDANGVQEQFNGLQGDITKLGEDVQKLSGLDENTIAQITALLENPDIADLADLYNRVEGTEGSIGKIERTNEGFATRFGTIEGKQDDLDASSKSYIVKIGTLEQTAAGFSTKFQEVDAAINGNEGKIGALEVSVGGLESKFKDGGDFSELKQTVNGISTKVENVQGQITTFEQTASGWYSQVQDLSTNRFSELRNDIDGLHQDLVDACTAISSRFENTLDTLRKEIEDSSNGLKTVFNASIDGITQRLEQTDSSVVNAFANRDLKLDGIEDRVKSDEGLLATLNIRAGEIEASVGDASGRVADLKIDVETIKSTVSGPDGLETKIQQTQEGINLVSKRLDASFNDLNESILSINEDSIIAAVKDEYANAGFDIFKSHVDISANTDFGNSILSISDGSIKMSTTRDESTVEMVICDGKFDFQGNNQKYLTIDSSGAILKGDIIAQKFEFGDTITNGASMSMSNSSISMMTVSREIDYSISSATGLIAGEGQIMIGSGSIGGSSDSSSSILTTASKITLRTGKDSSTSKIDLFDGSINIQSEDVTLKIFDGKFAFNGKDQTYLSIDSSGAKFDGDVTAKSFSYVDSSNHKRFELTVNEDSSGAPYIARYGNYNYYSTNSVKDSCIREKIKRQPIFLVYDDQSNEPTSASLVGTNLILNSEKNLQEFKAITYIGQPYMCDDASGEDEVDYIFNAKKANETYFETYTTMLPTLTRNLYIRRWDMIGEEGFISDASHYLTFENLVKRPVDKNTGIEHNIAIFEDDKGRVLYNGLIYLWSVESESEDFEVYNYYTIDNSPKNVDKTDNLKYYNSMKYQPYTGIFDTNLTPTLQSQLGASYYNILNNISFFRPRTLTYIYKTFETVQRNVAVLKMYKVSSGYDEIGEAYSSINFVKDICKTVAKRGPESLKGTDSSVFSERWYITAPNVAMDVNRYQWMQDASSGFRKLPNYVYRSERDKILNLDEAFCYMERKNEPSSKVVIQNSWEKGEVDFNKTTFKNVINDNFKTFTTENLGKYFEGGSNYASIINAMLTGCRNDSEEYKLNSSTYGWTDMLTGTYKDTFHYSMESRTAPKIINLEDDEMLLKIGWKNKWSYDGTWLELKNFDYWNANDTQLKSQSCTLNDYSLTPRQILIPKGSLVRIFPDLYFHFGTKQNVSPTWGKGQNSTFDEVYSVTEDLSQKQTENDVTKVTLSTLLSKSAITYSQIQNNFVTTMSEQKSVYF